jgi:hypothetical protein
LARRNTQNRSDKQRFPMPDFQFFNLEKRSDFRVDDFAIGME